MIISRTSDCKECAEILPLIDAINCKLFESAIDMYNNLAYSLNLKIPATDLLDLLTYKRILINKYVDMNYASDFSINQIANRVRILTTGCLTCVKAEMVYVFHKPSTTTSTTSSSSTTTTTTAVPYTSYIYEGITFTCGGCNTVSTANIENDQLLTIDKYYYAVGSTNIVRIDALLSADFAVGPHNIDASSESDDCSFLPCLSTTTTSTTAVPTFFLYSTSVSNCGSCDFPTQPSLESDVELEVGKYYYSPTRRKPAFISALLASGTDHIGTHSFDPLTKSDTCEEIVCPTTTTTTTII